MQEVWYPEDLADMVNQFKICATAKILVHEMFPTVDAGIVLDTDIVVMDDITNLWNNFQKFDSAQMAALAPVESHYSNVNILLWMPATWLWPTTLTSTGQL